MSIKDQFEQLVERVDNFNMASLAKEVWPAIETISSIGDAVSKLRYQLGADDYRKLSYSVLRNAFLIELVKVPKIETTKFRVRWVDQLDGDPRYCSYEECLEVAVELLSTLPGWLEDPSHTETLRLSFSNGIIPYEAPMDYARRFTQQRRLHQLGNLTWLHDEPILRTLKLRKHVIDKATSPDPKFFRSVLADKIRVKTYLTDRVLTGNHKTNREKRWEVHPDSVHFAERRACLAIEYALITTLCAFEGFPTATLRKLQEANILPSDLPAAICPISGDTLSYQDLRSELLNPIHGKSSFQIGHRNPLKLGDGGELAGHTADNVSWISADGNRIQGSLSLDELRKLIKRICHNYDRHGWWPSESGRSDM